ncbi:MAG: hypothetical protein VB111_12495 [Clostridiaceae bacterium]|nr:hypothetical protein [Clostridiaceae bacterium]
MKYIFCRNERVAQIIPELDPVFPGVPIEKRYAADFLSACIIVDDATEVQPGWVYDADTNAFAPPPEPPAPEPDPDAITPEEALNILLGGEV